MEIRISQHTLLRAAERGVTVEEIEDTIRTGAEMHARGGRLARWKVYPGDQLWRGKHYSEKRVEVIYVVEEDAIITVTAFCMYGEWSANG